MKITTEHYSKLGKAIKETLDNHNKDNALVNAYEAGQFNRSDKVKDLQRRFCFDVLYGSGLQSWVCSELYSYLDDNHIYTALKSICPKVSRKY
jgi:predicted TIM-barrel enzyme